MLLLILFSACSKSPTSSSDTTTAKATRQILTLKVEARGELKAQKSRKIQVPHFPTFWLQLKLVKLVPEGTQVKPGDLLGSIDKTDLQKFHRDKLADLKGAEAGMEQTRKEMEVQKSRLGVEIQQLQADADIAELGLKRLLQKPFPEDLAEAKAAVDKAKKSEAYAKSQYEAVRRLYAGGDESKAQLDQARLNLDSASVEREKSEAELRTVQSGATADEREKARLTVREAKEKLAKAREELDYKLRQLQLDIDGAEAARKKAQHEAKLFEKGLKDADFLSPKAGVVSYAKIFQGNGLEKIKEGMGIDEYNTLMSIEDTSAMVAEVEVEESQIALVRMGQTAKIFLDAIPGTVFTGTVTEIGSIAKEPGGSEGNNDWSPAAKGEPSGIRVFAVKVRIKENDPRLRSGMSGKLEVVAEEIKNALSIPVNAVFHKGNDSIVYVLKRGKPRERPVTLGRTIEGRILIQKGLEEGEDVCLTEPTS